MLDGGTSLHKSCCLLEVEPNDSFGALPLTACTSNDVQSSSGQNGMRAPVHSTEKSQEDGVGKTDVDAWLIVHTRESVLLASVTDSQ